MTIDASTLSALLVGLATLVTWLATQANARSKAQRRELRSLRQDELARRRYIHRLEAGYADRDLPLPVKPDGYPSEDDDDD